uniref:MARVEL domain-containing protein n=1 Tax=Panagrellus redivivus TaxID=6233 RepID=A0A7E4UNP1_PANRE
MEKAKRIEVQPIYVLLSPYACQNNKTVDFIAKHGNLFFAIVFVISMILLRLNTNDNSWIAFLPQFIFFSLAYMTGCISNNKWFQLIQILITFLFTLPYTICAIDFAWISFDEKHYTAAYLVSFVSFIPFLMVVYSTVIHLVYRKHYVRDLCTPQSVSILNFVDFFYGLVFCVCLPGVFPLLLWLQASHQENSASDFSWFEWACVSSFVTSYLVWVYIDVVYRNRSKSMKPLSYVQIDSDGRAWFSVCGCIAHIFKMVGLCFLWLFCCCGLCCNVNKLVRRNLPNVNPEEPQKLPLKPLPKMMV